MNERGLKTRTTISNAIDTKLLEKLKEYSKETSIPVSKLLDKSIELFLQSTERDSIKSELVDKLNNFLDEKIETITTEQQNIKIALKDTTDPADFTDKTKEFLKKIISS